MPRKKAENTKGSGRLRVHASLKASLDRAAARTDGALDLPSRFSFKARGASIEVVDRETKRRASFPKAATGIVAKVLGGLFSESTARDKPAFWIDACPEEHVNEALGVRLTRQMVAVDPSHPNRILGDPKSHRNGLVVAAYAISVDGEDHGYLVAHAAHRFVIVAPTLQERMTQHKGFDAAALRIEILSEGLRSRRELARTG